jgi:hypothetical protein
LQRKNNKQERSSSVEKKQNLKTKGRERESRRKEREGEKTPISQNSHFPLRLKACGSSAGHFLVIGFILVSGEGSERTQQLETLLGIN